MRIELKKFGDVLTSREAGREALAAFLPTLNSLGTDEKITIDFQDVSVLAPSWADEFIRPIIEKYDEKISFIHDTNPSVQAALRFTNPKLDLSKIRVFEDRVVFDEKTDDKIEASDKTTLRVIMFPYSDEEALRILKKNKIKKIRVSPVHTVTNSRLNEITQMLKQAAIEVL